MNTLSQIFQNIFSDNSNIMLAAIISLLLVILFVLLLHLYAKWFLAQAQAQSNARRRHRRGRAATVTVSDVLGPARFHHFHSFNIEDSPIFPSTSSSSHHNTSKGLDSSIIAGIPLFIYTTTTTTNSEVENNDEKVLEHDEELECVICLSSFIDGEMGRCLPKCGHGFHVECIDMWLSSHSNCPICRAPIILSSGIVENNDNSQLGSVIDDGIAHDDHVDDGGSSGFVEIVVDDFGQSSEIRENNENGGRVSSSSSDSSSVSSETETSTSLVIVGCSLKRMLSKVFPSSNNVNVNELQT